MLDLRERTGEVLEKGYLISLGTVDDNGVWVADVIYVYDHELSIYWMSSPQSRHSLAIEKNSTISGTITASQTPGEKDFGVQLCGVAAKLGKIVKPAIALYDGTVTSARPVRKPIPKTIKREKLSIDEDGVCYEWAKAGKELSDVNNESRMRFQDIIATRLNTRRAIREMVYPYVNKLQKDIDGVRNKLDQILQLLTHQPDVTP
jgi:uncharacterized protein YhbP (UPF0306 family)